MNEYVGEYLFAVVVVAAAAAALLGLYRGFWHCVKYYTGY